MIFSGCLSTVARQFRSKGIRVIATEGLRAVTSIAANPGLSHRKVAEVTGFPAPGGAGPGTPPKRGGGGGVEAGLKTQAKPPPGGGRPPPRIHDGHGGG